MKSMQARRTYYRHRQSGKVVSLSIDYSKPTHPFYETYELLGDEYEDDKTVVEAGPPAKSADKATWVTYALEAGFDVPDGMTKTDVVSLVTGDQEDGEN